MDVMTVRERSFLGNERSSPRVEVLQLVPSAVSRKHSRVSSARPVRCWLMLTQRTKSRPKSGDASQRMTRS